MPTNPPGSLPHAQTQPGSANPDQAGQTPFAALLRTWEYLRPYFWPLVAMLAAAITAAAAEIAIPLLLMAIIDGPIEHGDARALIPLGLAAIGFGVAEAGLNLYRRWVQASAVTGMERSMRDSLYAHLQRLHAGFHDEWQSGQLLSRATTDLSAIRRFAGFGIVFFITNVVTFVAVIALLIRLNWWLGLLTGCVFLPVLAICTRFERRYRVLSRRAQDQEGDLATYVEEAATGIRVLKALGRRDEAAARHAGQASLVRTTQIQKARLRGTFWAGLDLVPNAVIGLILLLGALAVSQGTLTLGGLVAFITLTLQLVWPIEAMGYILASGQEAATAAQRIYEIFDTEPAITDRGGRPPGSRPGPRGRQGRLRLRPRDLLLPGRRRAGAARGQPGARARRDGRPGRRDRIGQDHAAAAGAAAGRGVRRGHPAGRHRHPRPAAGRPARQVGCAFEDPTLFSASVRENVSYGAAGADEDAILAALAAAQAGLRRRPALGAGHQDRRARAWRCPAGSASGWRSPAPSWPGPQSCCSTTRCQRSTCTPRPRSPRALGRGAGRVHRAGGGAPAVHRACWPTGWRCSTTASSPPSARTMSCSPPRPATGS